MKTNLKTSERKMALKELAFEQWDSLSALLESYHSAYGLSEIQGLCLGVICTGRHKDIGYWQIQLEKTLLDDPDILVNALPQEGVDWLKKLLTHCFQALTHPHFELDLCLPDDTVPIETRLQAVSDWCKGFIFGLGLGGPDVSIWSQPNIKEALEDIAQIQKIDTQPAENQESEKDYIELVEYLKIATFVIFEECSESLILQGQSNHGLH